MKKILLTYCWILCCSLVLYGQEETFHHETLGIEQGMPSNVVYCVLQDSKGYIWAGTAKGVVRYDGEVLENYSTEDGLTDNEIFEMKEDGNGNIYFSTFSGGVSYYNGEDFLPHPQNSEIKKVVKDNWIFSWAIIDSVGGILFSIAHHTRSDAKDTCLYYVNSDTLYKYQVSENPNFFYKNIHITKDKQIVTWGVKDTAKREELRLTGLKRVSYMNDSTVLGINNKKAFIFSLTNDSYTNVEFKMITYAFRDKQNALWISTSEGVYYYPEGKLEQAKGQKIFEGIEVSYACADMEGNLWLATLNKGLVKVPSLYITDFYIQNVKRFFCINEHMYMQQYDKVFSVDSVAKEYSYFDFFLQDFYTHKIEKGHKKHEIGSVKDIVWLPQDSVLWLAHRGGVAAFKDGQKIRDAGSFNFKIWSASLAVYQNYVYIGTRKGLYVWDLELDKISKKEIPTLKTTIEDIEILPKGQIVLGTNGQGVFVQEVGADTFQHITYKEGSPSNFVHTLKLLNTKLLVGTNKGLGVYYWQTKQWEYLTSKNGLVSNDITSLAVYKGKVWVATLDGISKIDTNFWQFNSSKINIPIVLQEVNISGEKQGPAAYYEVAPLKQNINISFKAITFGNRPIYRYRLLGIHEEWQTIDLGQLQFNQLPPGSYELEVAAKLAGQEWGSAQKLLALTVIPHYTQTWWFLVLWILLVLVLVLAVGLLIVRGVTRRTNTQLLIKKLEQKALRSQMNPHFLFNTMNSIQYLITTDQKKAARRYITKLSMLLRKVLQYSEYSLISVSKEIETLKLYLDIETMRYQNHVNIQLDIAEDMPTYFKVPPMLLQPMLENALVHGLAPKEDHGHLTLKIEVLDEQILKITIIDDGIGREAAEKLKQKKQHIQTEKVSIGLTNIKKRIENLNKIHKKFIKFTVADHKPNELEPGTKIVLEFDQTKLT